MERLPVVRRAAASGCRTSKLADKPRILGVWRRSIRKQPTGTAIDALFAAMRIRRTLTQNPELRRHRFGGPLTNQ